MTALIVICEVIILVISMYLLIQTCVVSIPNERKYTALKNYYSFILTNCTSIQTPEGCYDIVYTTNFNVSMSTRECNQYYRNVNFVWYNQYNPSIISLDTPIYYESSADDSVKNVLFVFLFGLLTMSSVVGIATTDVVYTCVKSFYFNN